MPPKFGRVPSESPLLGGEDLGENSRNHSRIEPMHHQTHNFIKTLGAFLPLRVGGVCGADGERAGVRCSFHHLRVPGEGGRHTNFQWGGRSLQEPWKNGEKKPALPMNRRWSGDKKKSVLTPTLSSEERETLFPRLVNLSALHLHWFRGSMREFFYRKSSSTTTGEGPWGEGTSLPAPMEISAAGLVTATFNRHLGTAADSFSPREKDRMRGKSARNNPAMPCFFEPC